QPPLCARINAFPTTNVLYMFQLSLASRGITNMPIAASRVSLALVALLTPVSAAAQDIAEPQSVGRQTVTSTETGHRVVTSEAFQLIEHGLWSTVSDPERVPPPHPKYALETAPPNIVANYRNNVRSDFRRAIYLP